MYVGARRASSIFLTITNGQWGCFFVGFFLKRRYRAIISRGGSLDKKGICPWSSTMMIKSFFVDPSNPLFFVKGVKKKAWLFTSCCRNTPFELRNAILKKDLMQFLCLVELNVAVESSWKKGILVKKKRVQSASSNHLNVQQRWGDFCKICAISKPSRERRRLLLLPL